MKNNQIIEAIESVYENNGASVVCAFIAIAITLAELRSFHFEIAFEMVGAIFVVMSALNVALLLNMLWREHVEEKAAEAAYKAHKAQWEAEAEEANKQRDLYYAAKAIKEAEDDVRRAQHDLSICEENAARAKEALPGEERLLAKYQAIAAYNNSSAGREAAQIIAVAGNPSQFASAYNAWRYDSVKRVKEDVHRIKHNYRREMKAVAILTAKLRAAEQRLAALKAA